MARLGRSRPAGLIALVAVPLLATACTQSNIVADFTPPDYTIIDTLAGDVEIRRYGARARAGEIAAEDAVRGSAREIEAVAAQAGLVAVLATSDGDRQGLLTALEASPRWQAAGEPVVQTGDPRWAFLGLDRGGVAVPISRTADLGS